MKTLPGLPLSWAFHSATLQKWKKNNKNPSRSFSYLNFKSPAILFVRQLYKIKKKNKFIKKNNLLSGFSLSTWLHFKKFSHNFCPETSIKKKKRSSDDLYYAIHLIICVGLADYNWQIRKSANVPQFRKVPQLYRNWIAVL
jgi:hypothetical protein